MKKTLILLLCAITMNVMAYTPIVVEGYSWNVVNRNAMLDNAQTVIYQTYSEKIEGDTIINNVTYKKLWRIGQIYI